MWWLSLKCASALGNRRVDEVRTAVKALLSQRDPPDDLTWRATVEGPSLGLASTTLPLLTKGWGNALGCVAIGHASLALLLGMQTYSIASAGQKLDLVGIAILVATILVATLPVLVALEPAQISSHCDTLRGKLTAMRCKDPKSYERVEPLYDTLRLVNEVR